MASLAQNREIERRIALLKRFDFPLFLSALALVGVGLLCLYSVDANGLGSSFFKKQLIHLGVGLAPFAFFLMLDPRVWRRYANLLYLVNLGLLVLVLAKGHSGGGAQRWIQVGGLEFQPSELAKLLTILTVSSFLLARLDRIRRLSTFLLSILHIAIPVGLVFMQPHLGAALAILVAWLSVCLAAGVPIRFLVVTLLAVVLGLTAAIRVPGILKPYQKERVMAMINGNSQTNAYQALRAQIAFGAGGVTGQGLLKDDQGRTIPEQQNDFVFTVVGEEGGLVGCTAVLALFGFFFFRVWRIMIQAEEPFYKLVAAGIFGVLAFHTVVNLGMNLQLLPVVGLWLPFLSYGGTAIWLCMACVALLLSIRSRQRTAIF